MSLKKINKRIVCTLHITLDFSKWIHLCSFGHPYSSAWSVVSENYTGLNAFSLKEFHFMWEWHANDASKFHCNSALMSLRENISKIRFIFEYLFKFFHVVKTITQYIFSFLNVFFRFFYVFKTRTQYMFLSICLMTPFCKSTNDLINLSLDTASQFILEPLIENLRKKKDLFFGKWNWLNKAWISITSHHKIRHTCKKN